VPDRRRTPAPPLSPDVLTASARVIQANQGSGADRLFQYESWQAEAWQSYDTLGEFQYAVEWLANAMSRVRLTAAELVPGGDEPQPLTEGPAATLVEQLGGGIAGHAALMKSLALQLSVPGEGWLVAERADPRIPLDQADWSVKSTEEIRPNRSKDGAKYEVRVDDNAWRSLHPESLPVRIWEPHPRWSWKATSAAKAAIPIMRTIELLNRRIIATLVSRLAMNGLLLIPQEHTINTPAQYQDAADPFVEMLIDIAGKNIREPGAATASIPIPIKFAGDGIEKWKHLTFGDGVDKELIDEREKELGRLATTLNIPAEVLKGIGATNHWCVDDATEILTRSGWVTHDRLAPGDEVLTLNHDTGLSEWQPVGSVNRWDVTDLEMVSIEGRYHSSLTTPNHRWPVLRGSRVASRERVFATSDSLAANDFLITGAPCADLPTQAKYDDAFVELMAWYFTEGTCARRRGRTTPRVCIYQSDTANPDNVARIRRALTALYGPPTDGPLDSGGRRATDETLRRRETEAALRAEGRTVAEIAATVGVSKTQVYKDLRIVDGALAPRERITAPRWTMTTREGGMTVFRLNAVAGAPFTEIATDRVVPFTFVQDLTATQLDLFIDTAIRGDGHLMGGRTRLLGQKDPRMLAAFEHAAILSGRSVTNRANETNGFRRHNAHFVSVRDRTVFRPSKSQPSRPNNNFSEQTYTGVIWCPTTPNQTWLARRAGSVYFTGNTAWQLEESGIKLHISPVAELIVGGLTVGYLQPMLTAAGADLVGPNGGKLIVWYDTSELTARPDKSEKARDAYDRVEVSGAALRRESGLDEADKPTPDEKREQLLTLLIKAGNAEAYTALTGESLTPASPTAGPESPVPGVRQGPSESSPSPGTGARTPPPTRDNPPPPPDSASPAAAMAARRTRLGPVFARDVVGAGTGRRSPPYTNGHNGHSRDGPRE
jgi:hypothetical protein